MVYLGTVQWRSWSIFIYLSLRNEMVGCEQSLIFSSQSYSTYNPCKRAATPRVAINEYCNVVLCNNAGWDEDWTNFEGKGALQAV